jgi:hypothetical protein
MTRSAIFLALTVLLLASSPSVSAPIVGASANTIPQGTFMIDSWAMWADYTREFRTNLNGEGSSPGWTDFTADRDFVSTSVVPRLCYGVADWLTLRVAVPIEDRYLNPPEDAPAVTRTGLGDIVIDPKLQIYRGTTGYPRIALLAGLRLPTGDADSTPPLGDGSTDFMLGGAVTHAAGPLIGHACVSYWVNGESTAGVDIKDLWIASASIEEPVAGGWSLLWEFKSYVGERPRDYRRLYACPGIEWSGERATLGASGLISVSGRGGNGITGGDFDWAPYVRFYYRFF